MKIDTEWHSGPPPSVGWWPASICKEDCTLRWWNGKHWSVPVLNTRRARTAGARAHQKSCVSELILWRHRPADWPERSRT